MSAQTTNTEIDIKGVNGDEQGAAKGVAFGAELMHFAEAVAERNPQKLAGARETLLRKMGSAALVDAAGVAANFQRMVRIADSIGIPVDNMEAELGREVRAELELERFPSARNTLEATRSTE